MVVKQLEEETHRVGWIRRSDVLLVDTLEAGGGAPVGRWVGGWVDEKEWKNE